MELDTAIYKDLVVSIKRYASENMSEPLGDLAAGLLLDFVLEEVGPVIYNRAIADAQTRMQVRVADLGGELFAEEGQYWIKAEARRRARRS